MKWIKSLGGASGAADTVDWLRVCVCVCEVFVVPNSRVHQQHTFHHRLHVNTLCTLLRSKYETCASSVGVASCPAYNLSALWGEQTGIKKASVWFLVANCEATQMHKSPQKVRWWNWPKLDRQSLNRHLLATLDIYNILIIYINTFMLNISQNAWV